MSATLAATPLLAVLVLMLGLRWPAWRAGLAGLAISLVLAWGPFSDVFAAGGGTVGATIGSLTEAVFTAATILWIVVPALALHQMQLGSGAMETLESSLGRLTGDPRVLALLVAWFFALFMEGAAGFGTSAALAAPSLAAAGFPPLRAVILALVGHAAGVTFGALGTPVVPQVAATGLDPLDLGRAAAPYQAVAGMVLVAVVVVMAARAGAPGDRTRTPVPATVTAAVLFLVPFLAIAWFVGPELPTLGGALAGGLVFVPLVRRFRPATAGPTAPAGDATLPSPLRSAAPYLAVVLLVLVTRLGPGVADMLRQVELRWSLPGGYGGSFAPLFHPGTLLAGGLVLGWWVQRLPGSALTGAVRRAVSRLAQVAVALVAMLGLSRVMVHAGMIEALADTAADLAGAGWPLLAPAVGALGTFITGSATASNILFTDFQAATAERLGQPLLPITGAQASGAALGNMVAPHNVIAATAVVEAPGGEGEVLATTLWVAAVCLALAGGLALGAVALVG